MRRTQTRLTTVLLVFLLLGAQFGALTHASWHAGHLHADLHAHEHAHNPGDTGNTHEDELPAGHHAELCTFDLVFGQVLGGVHACAALALPVAGGAIAALDIPNARLKAEALAPKSRGPPRALL